MRLVLRTAVGRGVAEHLLHAEDDGGRGGAGFEPEGDDQRAQAGQQVHGARHGEGPEVGARLVEQPACNQAWRDIVTYTLTTRRGEVL